MTAVNLATVRGLVRFRGDYPRSPKFSDGNVNNEIQTSWSELHELIEDEDEGYWDKSDTVTTTASVAFVAPPSDAWRVKGVDILDGGEYRELQQVGVGDRNRFGQAANQPLAYRLTERGIDLFPTPNAVYTLRVTYARKVVALDETSTTEMYNDWHDYVVTSTLLKLDEREERSLTERQNRLDRITGRIIKAIKRRRQEPQLLTLREVGPDDMEIY